jgi:hypothetical protein
MNTLRLSAVLLCLVLAGCGFVSTKTTTGPQAAQTFKQYSFTPIRVDSEEQTEDAATYNTQLKATARASLMAMLSARGATWAKPGTAAPTIAVRIYAVYGNRVLRALVGWGVGAAKISVDITLQTADGHALYATHTVGKMQRGIAGGDVLALGQRTVKQAFEDFAEHL